MYDHSRPPAADPQAEALRAGRDALRLEALGLMTAGIVHDLGKMIQVLSSATGILNPHPDLRAADGLEPVVASAVQSLERATAMIGQIAGFGRSGDVDMEDLDVTLCLTALERLVRWITAESIDLELRVSRACPKVTCSRRAFEHAILNLVLNARDAMPAGGNLIIEAAASGPRSSCVAVCITDTGEGMDAPTLARAFEPFFTTRGGQRGAGLGLAMVRRFAQTAGGGVAARSQPGRGTTVTLQLPAAARWTGRR